MGLMVGVGRSIITPQVGGQLYGYRPDVMSTSVHDDLTATALCVQSGERRALLVSATVCLISTELADEIRLRISNECSVPREHIIVAATHTHSGPNTCGSPGWGEIDRDYCEGIFVPSILRAAQEAACSLQPVRLGVGTCESLVGINRRELTRKNNVALGQNPWGCMDKTMTVLCFKGADGKDVANLIHYGAHCTASGCNTEITRDWAGVMIDRLETLSGAPTLFVNGAEGDTGPRLTNAQTVGDIGLAMELGGVAAGDAVRAYRSIAHWREADMDCVSGELHIPLKERIPQEEARSRLAEIGEAINIKAQTAHYLRTVLQSYEDEATQAQHIVLPQTLLRIGGVVLVPFAYELFSEIALRLRQYASYPYVLCLSNANGSRGYLPSQDAICRGGYEVDMFLTAGVQSMTEDADYHFVCEILKMQEELLCTE